MGASLYNASNPASVISNLTLTILSFFTAPESYNSLAFKTPPVILIILVVVSFFSGVDGVFPSTIPFESFSELPSVPSVPSTEEFSLIIEIFLSVEFSSDDCCGGVIVVVLFSSSKSEAYSEI